MELLIKTPSECSEGQLDDFERLVLKGGEVSPGGLRNRIEAAERLVFVGEATLLAVGAIKNPNPGYKSSVFEKATVPDREADFAYELGWLYASPDSRGKGVGNILMTAALKVSGAGGIFATTRSDNDAMHYLFKKFSFEKLGSDYSSAQGDYQLGLYAHRP